MGYDDRPKMQPETAMASLFKRIRVLLSNNLDELLHREAQTRAPDGRRLADLEAQHETLRAGLVEALTREKQLERELAARRTQAERWRERAGQARDRGGLQEALARQRRLEAGIDALERAHAEARQTTATGQGRLRDLAQEIAAAQQQLGQTTRQRVLANRGDSADASESLGRVGIRLADLRARLRPRQSEDELARAFQEIEREARLEQTRASLKREPDED